MTNFGSLITIISLAVLVSFALTSCQAKDAAQPTPVASLSAKLAPQTKPRNARSLGDMFEKMRSKIFGSRKQAASSSSATSSQIQPAASLNVASRQPWGDLNSFNQQYSPFPSISSNYQWPSSSGSQYINQQYNPLNGFINSQSASSAYPGLSNSQSQQGSSSLMSGIDGQQQSQSSSLSSAANQNSANNGGLLSSASHLIAQYLSPSSSSGASSSSAQQSQLAQSMGQNQLQQNGQGQNMLTPQQTQYNEFSSILDSMVAQTGASSQRQPSLNQYLNGVSAQQNQPGIQQQQPNAQGYQQGSGNLLGAGSMVGDNDMSGSNNIQSYLPASSQQASQKSSMVGLAESLSPGSNFNKLVSFPFTLSSNEDPSKEGRYKLHIPFLNQHVKRSDQQQQVSNSAALLQKQQQQQYLNSYYNPHQYSGSLSNQAQPSQQLVAQASQVVPTIVSPQSSISQSQSPSVSVAQSSPVAASSVSGSSSPSQSASASSSSSIPQSSSSSILSSANNPALASSSIASQSNPRPAWSVADLQSSSSSSKLIPMPSAASSSVDSASSSQS